MPRRLVVILLALTLPLTLAACGGDDDGDGGGEDEDQITEVIETSVKTTDPADCTELQTQKFLEQSNFATGDAALQECEKEAADTADDPDSVDVSEVAVDGESATANAAFTGGPLDATTVSLALVKEGDQWKLDEITDIPEFDFEAFQQAFTEDLEAGGDIPPQLADCITQAIAQAGEEQVKTVILSGDGQQLNALFDPCLTGG